MDQWRNPDSRHFFPVLYSFSRSLSAACSLHTENQIFRCCSCCVFWGKSSCFPPLRRSIQDLGRLLHMYELNYSDKQGFHISGCSSGIIISNSSDHYFEDFYYFQTPCSYAPLHLQICFITTSNTQSCWEGTVTLHGSLFSNVLYWMTALNFSVRAQILDL